MVAHFMNNACSSSLAQLGLDDAGTRPRADGWPGRARHGRLAAGAALLARDIGHAVLDRHPMTLRTIGCSALHQLFLLERGTLLEGRQMPSGEEKQALGAAAEVRRAVGHLGRRSAGAAARPEDRAATARGRSSTCRATARRGSTSCVRAHQDLQGHARRQGADARLPHRGRLLRRALPARRRPARGDGRGDGRVDHRRDRARAARRPAADGRHAPPTSSRAR